MPTPHTSPEIVLVLGGGGIRGFAHTGVLSVCEELGLRVRGIVGSSVGALVGAFAAAGHPAAELAAIAGRLRKGDLFDIDYRALLVRRHRARSLYRGRGIIQFLETHLAPRRFDELDTRLVLNAVNLNTGSHICFGLAGTDDVPLHDAIRASCALPGFYPPVRIGNDDYVDGGVLDPLPIGLARHCRERVVSNVAGMPVALGGGHGGPVVVAVHLEQIRQDQRVPTPPGMFGLLDRSETIRQQIIVRRTLEDCADLPLILVAPDVTDRGIFDFREIGAVIAAGEAAARATLTNHPLLFGHAPDPERLTHPRPRRRSETREIEVGG